MTSSVSTAYTGSGTSPFSGDESMNNDDTNDDDSVDVRIIVEKDLNGHSFATMTVVIACASSVEGAIPHFLTNAHSVEPEMPPEKGTEQHRVTELSHNWPSTFKGPHRLSLASERMRYHPIDRGRCICPSFFHCQPLE